MTTKGLQDPWGPQKKAKDSIKIRDTYELAINFGFFRMNRRYIRICSSNSEKGDKSSLHLTGQPKGFLKGRLQSWRKPFQKCVQVVQAANAVRLVLVVFIPLLLEFVRNR